MRAFITQPSYMTAVVGLPYGVRHLSGLELEELQELAELTGLELEELAAMDAEELAGLFDVIGKALGGAVKGIGKGISNAVEAVDKAYVAVTPRWLRKGLGVVAGPAKFVVDATDNIVRGQRIDRALLDAVNNQVEIFRMVGPIAQLGLSFIPGVGQGVAAAIGAGLALADGKPISEALIAAVKGAIPGGPIAQRALEMGARAVVDVAQGKRIDTIALNALRSQVPGGKAALAAFDTGLALAQGKKLQDAGMAGAAALLPNHPLAQGAFDLTKRALAGKPIPGAPARHGGPVARVAPQRAAARPKTRRPAPVAVRPMAMRTRSANYDAGGSTSDWGDGPAPAKKESSAAIPIALGAAALVATGGGVWWLNNRRTRS